MSRLLRTTLAVSLGLALLVPGTAGAQDPPPEEVVPPPPTTTAPQDPVVQIEPPPTVTIKVPPLAEPKPKKAAPKPAAQPAEPTRPEPARRASPRRDTVVSEPEPVAPRPDVEETMPAPKAAAKPKPQRKKLQRPKPRVVAKATAPPARTIRDPDRAGAVLAAQFTLDDPGSRGIDTGVVAFAIVLAALLGTVVGVVGAAPLLAERWPNVFVPVIDATERIMLVGVCLAGAALTVAVTWALAARAG